MQLSNEDFAIDKNCYLIQSYYNIRNIDEMMKNDRILLLDNFQKIKK